MDDLEKKFNEFKLSPELIESMSHFVTSTKDTDANQRQLVVQTVVVESGRRRLLKEENKNA